MRVVIITPFYKPSIGGVEYIVYHTAKELAKRGLEVHVITTTHDNKWRKVALPGTTTDESIIIHRLEPSWIRVGYATIMKGLREKLQEIKPDIVHCHNLHPHLFQTMKWKGKLKYKLIAQLHYPAAAGIDHLLARTIFRLTMYELTRNQSKIDVFIAHTNIERQWLISKGIEKSRIKIIRYPCIPDELLNYKPTINIHEKFDADKIIINISRIHPRKGQHLVIKAIKYLNQEITDFKVYIAGPVVDTKYISRLRRLIEKYQLKKYVELKPYPLSEREKFDAIATADVFAYTPIKDYTPVILLESLALRTSVAVTKVGAIPELLSLNVVVEELIKDAQGRSKALLEEILWDELKRLESNAIVLAEPKPTEIAKAIHRVLQNKNRINLEVLAKVASIHTASAIVNRLAKLYESLIP